MDTWDLIDKLFKENPEGLVAHHLESYNDFFKNGIFRIFKEKNPVRINSNYDPEIDDYRDQCIMYFGGKNGDRLYFWETNCIRRLRTTHIICFQTKPVFVT